MNGTILYATSAMNECCPGSRVERSRQSAAARDLMARLVAGAPSSVQSKSHSRTMVAAAAADLEGLRLGIDIEWKNQQRAFSGIAGLFLNDAGREIGPDAFYRAWTFGEAYLKAFQHLPAKHELDRVLDLDGGAHIVQLDGRVCLYQDVIAEAFQMSLVWRPPQGKSCDLRRLSLHLADAAADS